MIQIQILVNYTNIQYKCNNLDEHTVQLQRADAKGFEMSGIIVLLIPQTSSTVNLSKFIYLRRKHIDLLAAVKRYNPSHQTIFHLKHRPAASLLETHSPTWGEPVDWWLGTGQNLVNRGLCAGASDLSSSYVQQRWTGWSRWQLRGLSPSRPPPGRQSAVSSPGWTCEPRWSGPPSPTQLFSTEETHIYLIGWVEQYHVFIIFRY